MTKSRVHLWVFFLLFCSSPMLNASDEPVPLRPQPPQDSTAEFTLPYAYPVFKGDIDTMDLVIRPEYYSSQPAGIKMDVPREFDLRNLDGEPYISPALSQSGGTCWAFSACAAVESNLMIYHNWVQGRAYQWYASMEPYHMDWWSGFNDHFNADLSPAIGNSLGLMTHWGGDYLMAAAYFSRMYGGVDFFSVVDANEGTYLFYNDPPAFTLADYVYYYPREILFLTAGSDLTRIGEVKAAVMQGGAVGTAMCYQSDFMRTINGKTIHYQPAVSSTLPNHSVVIAGWNDTVTTQAPNPGAWLCKNSWGEFWADDGFFWISYYDKYACQHPEMGAVSFRDVIIPDFSRVYCHDYHGWRDTYEGVEEAFNIFVAQEKSVLTDVSFISTRENQLYTIKIYDSFENGQLSGELSSTSGETQYIGLHTVTLSRSVSLQPADDFYIYVQLPSGSQAYDCTDYIVTLLGAESLETDTVYSTAAPGQSMYLSDGSWYDLYDVDTSANFCIKGLTRDITPVISSAVLGPVPLSIDFEPGLEGVTIDQASWYFGDGTTSHQMFVNHVYEAPGIYDVALDVVTPEQEVIGSFNKGMIMAYADTIGFADEPELMPNGSFRLDVIVRNYLPIKRMTIPFLWGDQYPLSIDSISLNGLRTKDVATAEITSMAFLWDAAAIEIQCPWNKTIEPGYGSVVSIFVTMDNGTWPPQTPFQFWPYSHYGMTFEVYAGEYTPVQGFHPDCCEGRVGDVNVQGGDEPTIGDINMLVDLLFISQNPLLIQCVAEADINQSGGPQPTLDDVTIGDVTLLVDYLFITGSTLELPGCL